MNTPRLCPRCEAALVGSALSRLTRDGGAEVYICDRCGQRESLYGLDPADQVPLAAWPVEVERLVSEERALLERFRGGDFLMLGVKDIDDG